MSLVGKQIGDIVDIYCTRCRLNLDGSVSALVSGEVVKVTCRTCHNEVKYRPSVDLQQRKQKALERLMRQRSKKFAGLPASEIKGPNPLRQIWDELTDKVDARSARVYDPTRTYELEEAILHKKHGMGIVHDVFADGTINVLFRNGFVELTPPEPEDDF